MLALTLPLASCLAAYVVGGAVRAGQKNIDLVLSPGVTAATLAAKKDIGISVNGANGMQPYSIGGGGTNTTVYADMLAREFLRLGYQTRTVTEAVSEATTSRQIKQFGEKGFDLILICNLNFSTTTNMADAMVGGEGMKTGVTSFTLKGFDPRSGGTLFIASAEYGTAKAAGTVAQDMSALYRDVVNGAVKPTRGPSSSDAASASQPPTEQTRTPSALSAPAAEASPPRVTARQLVPLSARGASTPVSRTAPVLVSPGIRVAPGPKVASAGVSLTWNAVENATGYAVALKDMTLNAVVFSAEADANKSTVDVPIEKLVAGHSYRWSSRARTGDGYGAYAPHLFFRR